MNAKLLIVAAAAVAVPEGALAQRTAENLVTQSADAFGKTIGNEKIGLYSTEDVRGFNPIDAGNMRIEGLYFDHVERVPTRLVEGSTVRVGVAAQGFSFPAPTGIVDYDLTLYRGKFDASGMIERGPYGGAAGNVELKVPISGDNFGLAGGVGFREQVRPEGGKNSYRTVGITAAWQPYQGALLAAFAGAFTNDDDEAHVTFFPAGEVLPPRVQRGVFLGQEWADKKSRTVTGGVIGKFPLQNWLLEGGLFTFSARNLTNFADLLRGVTADGKATNRILIYDPGSETQSLSGEGRLTRIWQAGDMQHRLVLSARGRIKDRLFGGTQRIDLGPSSAVLPDFRDAPALLDQVKDKDNVRQMSFGVAYGFKWLNHGSIDLSVSRAQYRKNIRFADAALASVLTRDRPMLVTATGTLNLSARLTAYGGFVRGLEEALVAPDIATNRSEAPPAIRTRQMDFGLRYAITPKMSLVAGLFSVQKPYFNLDPSLRYRQLGQVDNRGLEISLAGPIRPGLSLVAGALLLDHRTAGEAVEARLIGVRPVGVVRTRGIANLDWRFANGTSPWSVDIAFEALSSRVANARNTLSAPPRQNVNLGTRYRFKVDGHPVLFRAQAMNLFNDYGWQVSSSGGFTYSNGRTFMAQFVMDL